MAVSKSNYPTHFSKNFTKLPKVWADLQAQFEGVSYYDLRLTVEENAKSLTWVRAMLKSSSAPRAVKASVALEKSLKNPRNPTEIKKVVAEAKPTTKPTTKPPTVKPSKTTHNLKVGDILHCNWGYDQTNCDFYEVVALRGKTQVEIASLDNKVAQGHTAYDMCVPVKGSAKGKGMRKKVQKGGGIMISSYMYASKWDGKPQYRTNSLFGH